MSVSLLNIKDYVIGRTFDFSKLSDDVMPQQEENLVFTEIVLTEISPDKEEHKAITTSFRSPCKHYSNPER
jgi:hypothetical protein